MTMPDSELRRLLRMPLQAFRREAASATPAEVFVPADVALTGVANVDVANADVALTGVANADLATVDQAKVGVALQAKRLTATRLRVSLSSAHDIARLLHLALADQPEPPAGSAPEATDWHGREFRRMLRTWTPQSHVDITVHPANLRFLPAGDEIFVGGWASSTKRDNAMSLAMLAAPLSGSAVSQAMAALAAGLALAELHGAARFLRQKRLSRNASLASAAAGGPQPAAPPGRLPFRRPNLRPALQRALPTRRNLHFATA